MCRMSTQHLFKIDLYIQNQEVSYGNDYVYTNQRNSIYCGGNSHICLWSSVFEYCKSLGRRRRHWYYFDYSSPFGIDPAYTTLLINIPLILIGGKILGKRSFYYTILGTVCLSVFLWIWQRIPLQINLDHDLFIVSILAGLFAGFGSGLVYRNGGTTGGADVIARILEQKIGFTMGKSLLVLILLF